MTGLRNKTALVTGASGGIGRATASALAESGAHVLVHYGRSAQDAESLVAGKNQQIGQGGIEKMTSTKSAAGTALVKNESVISENQQERLANPSVVEEIRQRAYEIYVGRGGTHGSDLDDWLQAERELKEKYNAS